MAEATAKNYTDEMVATMIDQYTATPTRATVDALADEFGKTARSIIAKLSREGVYVAQPKTTKSGTPIVRKAEIVARIAGQLGVELEAPSLVKASTPGIDARTAISDFSSASGASPVRAGGYENI